MSGWIPYWREEQGVESAIARIDQLEEVNPFIYTVKKDGTLFNNVDLNDSHWKALQKAAEENGVAYIPTIMWYGKEPIFKILSDEEARKRHIQSIVMEIFRYGFDGIDIDYEGKSAETRLYFSLFLKELRDAIGYDRELVCTIESRMPVEDRYAPSATIPTFIEYSNDFSQINQYCDRVRIMAYDQGRADQTLIREREHPYTPVSDVAWVEKVMRVAAEEIDPSKLSIGVATYGYEYDMFLQNGIMRYSRLWSFNQGYATKTAETVGIEPTRGVSGEMQLVFPASDSPEEIPLPNATRVLVWSDGEAVDDKIGLAHTLGLHGIAIFKIDGGEDVILWDRLSAREAGNVVATEQLANVITTTIEAEIPFTPSVNVPSRDLELDDVGEDVRQLQKLLNQAGFTVSASGPGSIGNETTIFGYATQSALIEYQKAKGLSPAIGYYGPLTRASLGSVALVSKLNRDLELGDTGEDVRLLQSILNREGFVIAPSGIGSPGQETNYFGAKTQAAVIKYQSAKGLSPAIGYVGPLTRASLLGG